MTSFVMKIIAIVAMTCDHFAMIIGQPGLMEMFPSMSLQVSYDIVRIMSAIGRLAFPLFAFMLVEGCNKTRTSSVHPRYICLSCSKSENLRS